MEDPLAEATIAAREHRGAALNSFLVFDLDKEYSDLATADRHIAAGERRVARQEARISELDRETAASQQLLTTYRAILEQWRAHRAQIAAVIHQLEERRGRPSK